MTFLHVKNQGKSARKQVLKRGAAHFSELSPRSARVMRALEDGASLQWAVSGDEAGWWLEGEEVTVAVTGLLARDLVQRGADGVGRLSAPGIAWLRRRQSMDRAGRALIEGDRVAADLAMPFRDQHQAIVIARRKGERLWVNQGESPLGWLRRRRDKAGNPMVSEAQFLAGERLRSDFERAGIPTRTTSVWSGLGTIVDGGQHSFGGSETQQRARTRYQKALAELGTGLADVVVRVACYQEGLSAVEDHLGWPARSAKVVLALGLDRLSVFYGIPKNNQIG